MSESKSDDTRVQERSPEEIAAQIEKARAEAARARAEAEKLVVETREATANAIRAESTARVKLLDEEKQVELHARTRVTDWDMRVYRFEDQVSAVSVNKCIGQLEEWHRLDSTCPIEVIFLSPGGSVIHGMALFDHLSSLSIRGGGTHHLTTGSRGYAASMAGVLLQAGDTRWIGRQSYLMIHEVSAGASGKIGEIEDSFEFYKKICSQLAEIFVTRAAESVAERPITKAAFKKGWEKKDWWLFSDQCLSYGFVDQIR